MTGDVLQRLRTVFAAYDEVAGVWLFGSHARGTASSRSDLDLAIDPTPETGAGARARKLDMLTDLVGAGFENVDLVILDTDDPVLRFEAIGPNVLVYAAPGYDPAEAFVQALRQYDDTAPLRARMRAAYYERLLRHDG
jgi:predicted nucleotidyltransferase